MKKSACLLTGWIALSMSAPILAENRAVNIHIGSIGGALDNAAVRSVRQLMGHAVASSTVDRFIVSSPSTVSALPIEGGLSACAEAGFGVKKARFDAFIQELRSIHPKPGTFYRVARTASCSDDGNVACTQDAQLCSDGSSVGRIPPSCNFAPCPGK